MFRSSTPDQVPFVKARRAHSKVDFDRWEATTTAPTLNGFDNRSDGRATVVIVVDKVLAFDSTFGGMSSVHDDVSPPVKVGSGANIPSPPAVLTPESVVRRLTPRECERLMGWPDDHTRWRADGREQSDTARYKQCGNGVVSPVAEWVGRRLRFLSLIHI